jgi:hypothetical protein
MRVDIVSAVWMVQWEPFTGWRGKTEPFEALIVTLRH